VLWLVASAFATILASALLFQRGERDDVSVYLRQVEDVQESFALRYARVDPAYRRLESSPESVSDQLPELRRTAHTLTVLRERAEALAAPTAALELRRRLIAYFREQELIAQELVKVTAFVREIQQTERSITRAAGVLRGRLGRAVGADGRAVAAATYAKRLETEAEQLAQLDTPPVVDLAKRMHVESLRAQATAVRRLADTGELEATVREIGGTSLAFMSGTTARAQRQTARSYDTRSSRVRQLREQFEREQRSLERFG
jgi:hypothetical protein